MQKWQKSRSEMRRCIDIMLVLQNIERNILITHRVTVGLKSWSCVLLPNATKLHLQVIATNVSTNLFSFQTKGNLYLNQLQSKSFINNFFVGEVQLFFTYLRKLTWPLKLFWEEYAAVLHIWFRLNINKFI